MSVNWYWKNKIGEISYYDLRQKTTFKVNIYAGNCMAVFIYNFKKLNEETGKAEKYYTFINFFNDLEHAKRVLKEYRLENFLAGDFLVKKVKLCITQKNRPLSNKEMLKLAEILTKMKYKVELY